MITFYNWAEGQEDIFLISVGEDKKTNTNILIDGGNKNNVPLEMIEKEEIEKIDCVVLTHIDQDHIRGLINIFKVNKKIFESTVIVYNKFINGVISYKQAVEFENLIENYNNRVSYKENQEQHNNIIFLSVEERKLLPKIEKNIIYITFLAPTKDKVGKLYEYYKYFKKMEKKESGDDVIVNQSSIMFLLEYGNNSILMTGDGFISDIIENIKILSSKEILQPIKRLNLIKIPHHGSKENNEQLDELLRTIECNDFIITNKFNDKSVKINSGLANILKNKNVYSSSYDGELKFNADVDDIRLIVKAKPVLEYRG